MLSDASCPVPVGAGPLGVHSLDIFQISSVLDAKACLTLWLFAVELWVWALRISSSFFL